MKFTNKIDTKQKIAHYASPDYCIVTRRSSLNIILLELGSLFQEDGVFYEVYDEIVKKEDF